MFGLNVESSHNIVQIKDVLNANTTFFTGTQYRLEHAAQQRVSLKSLKVLSVVPHCSNHTPVLQFSVHLSVSQCFSVKCSHQDPSTHLSHARAVSADPVLVVELWKCVISCCFWLNDRFLMLLLWNCVVFLKLSRTNQRRQTWSANHSIKHFKARSEKVTGNSEELA